VISALVVALVLLDLAVTVGVARSGLYEPGQKRLQYLLIWLLPLLGAAIVGLVLREQLRQPRPGRHGITGNPYVWWNYPDEHEGHSQHHGGGGDGGGDGGNGSDGS
jgi:hypothetical protein